MTAKDETRAPPLPCGEGVGGEGRSNALRHHSLRLRFAMPLDDLVMLSSAGPGGRIKQPVNFQGRADIKVEGVCSLPMSVGIGVGDQHREGWGGIEIYSSDAYLNINVSEQEFQTLMAARLSARRVKLNLQVLGVSDRPFDELDLSRVWSVKSYALTLFDAPHPPQGRGRDEL